MLITTNRNPVFHISQSVQSYKEPVRLFSSHSGKNHGSRYTIINGESKSQKLLRFFPRGGGGAVGGEGCDYLLHQIKLCEPKSQTTITDLFVLS